MRRFKLTSRFFLVAILLMVLSGVARGEEQFRRWGVGYGRWAQTSAYGSSYYSEKNGFGLRCRLTEDWAVTVNGQFGQTVEEGDYEDTWWFGSPYQESQESDFRTLGLEVSRRIQILPKLLLRPAIRMIHHYSYSISESARLWEHDHGDWDLTERRSTSHSDVLHVGFGFRPELFLHPRLSIETGFFLDYWKSHSRSVAWEREEDETGEVELDEGESVVHRSGWKFTGVNPSLSMSLTLYFYF
jgi:hypothetical protein